MTGLAVRMSALQSVFDFLRVSLFCDVTRPVKQSTPALIEGSPPCTFTHRMGVSKWTNRQVSVSKGMHSFLSNWDDKRLTSPILFVACPTLRGNLL